MLKLKIMGRIRIKLPPGKERYHPIEVKLSDLYVNREYKVGVLQAGCHYLSTVIIVEDLGWYMWKSH